MSICFELPQNIEQRLRKDGADLDREAKEVYLVALFRRGVVSHYDLGLALGLDRFETDALLKRHQVAEQSLRHQDVDADVRSINDLLAPPVSS
jgi:predicted HTH domain antitoxin